MPISDPTRIATNIAGLQALNALRSINAQLGLHQLRLATGKRINEAGDDPAGLSIATKFRARSEGLGQALSNISDAKNLLAVTEGGLQKINDILVVMETKATQAASDTLGSAERTAISTDLEALNAEIDAIVSETQWNSQTLLNNNLNGSGNAMTFQTGSEDGETTQFYFTSGKADFDSSAMSVSVGSTAASSTVEGALPGQVSSVSTNSVNTGISLTELNSGTYRIAVSYATAAGAGTYTIQLFNGSSLVTINSNEAGTASGTSLVVADTGAAAETVSLGVGLQVVIADGATGTANVDVAYTRSGHSVSSAANAATFLASVQTAISTVSEGLQKVGSLVARLSFKEENVTVAKTNVEAAFNRIMNADMAYEQLEATKLAILQQTATAMLAQANAGPQTILNLFR